MIPRGALRLGLAAIWMVALGAAVALPTAARAQADTSAQSADSAAIPEPTGYVNDHAGVLDEPSRAKLEAFLDQVEKKTGAQFAILTVTTTAPETPDEYKVRVFERWKIGKRGEDNGLLVLLSMHERELKFETGYGLEGTLPDGLESRIFREVMAPRFQQGDFAGGITAGVLECAKRVAAEKGVTLEWNGSELRYGSRDRDQPTPSWLVAMIVFFAIAALVSRIAGFGRRRRFGGWYGPWGGGFGGFGGGGFGGGGFGGGSFGGFGGGGSGGGGGGGKW